MVSDTESTRPPRDAQGGSVAAPGTDEPTVHPEEPWPPVGYEEVAWDVHPVSGMPRQDRAWIGRPYRAAVPPAIAELDIRTSGEVAALAEEAASEVRAFDAEMGHEIAPFAAVLLRTESAASSQIEQLSASARKIAEAEAGSAGSEHARMIIANVRAMTAALELSDRLDADAILAMHDVLISPSDPEVAGRWRVDQVWIGGPGGLGAQVPHRGTFVPPVAGRVPAAIDDLVDFAARDDLPALAQAAITHAQFETIHPFVDGNGRTGRALLHAMLRAKGISRHVSVPISAGLLTDTDGYYDALIAFRAGKHEPIIATVSRAALVGVDNGRHLVSDLAEVVARWEDQLTGIRRDAASRRLTAALLRTPVVSAPMVRAILGIDKNEHRHIETLVTRGILVAHTDYKTRNRTWRAPDVLEVLDRYSQRAGRRGSS